MSEKEINTTIGKNISYYMSSKNKNQEDLATYMGVSQATISNWCTGTKLPRMNKIDKICNFFNITRTELMTEHQESKNESNYYINPETAKMAQEISDNEELSLLFDAARDAAPEDLKTVHSMLMALKRKEKGE